jgi:hypothetical protein
MVATPNGDAGEKKLPEGVQSFPQVIIKDTQRADILPYPKDRQRMFNQRLHSENFRKLPSEGMNL